ncbi:MAG: hypothetical protein HY293_14855 [Planctomycetes bacterium]|nr:hypothetical protein [Planctomycetota bacterium]
MSRFLKTAPGTLLFLLLSSTAWAQRNPGQDEDFFSKGPTPLRLRYVLTAKGEEGVQGQAADFALVEQEFSLHARVWGDEQDSVSFQGGLRFQDIRTGATLPDSGRPFPDELWAVNLGARYQHRFDGGQVLGGGVGVGSASDQPFESSRELVEHVLIFFHLPSGEHESWHFFLGYSNNRDYANSVPIPGVEYLYRPSPDFRLMVGFPMEAVEWRPVEDLTLSLRTSFVHNVHATITCRLAEPLRVYAGFDWNSENYLLVDRADPKDRFHYEEKQAKAGLKVTLAEGLVLDVGGGTIFDRSYREKRKLLGGTSDRVDIDSGLCFLASLEFRLGRSGDREEAPSK